MKGHSLTGVNRSDRVCDCKYQGREEVTEKRHISVVGGQYYLDIHTYVSDVRDTGDCYHVTLIPCNPDIDRL